MIKITEDGKSVIGGGKVYEIYHTHGLPLSLALNELSRYNFSIDWREYFITALNDGMILENEYRRVCEAVIECYGDDYFNEWNKRAKLLLLEILKGDKHV